MSGFIFQSEPPGLCVRAARIYRPSHADYQYEEVGLEEVQKILKFLREELGNSAFSTNFAAENPRNKYRLIMTEQEIFTEQAKKGYLVCYAEHCPMKEQCLHWIVWQHTPATMEFCHSVNPRYKDVATERCPCFRSARKVKMAKGMTGIFTDDMPRRVEKYVRQQLTARYNRTYFFEYRKGKFLIPPAMQEEIRTLFRQAGWNGEVNFDGYVEEYEW